ncbi:MAG: serine/threonine-protein kinase [Kofleriaceae bacterium]
MQPVLVDSDNATAAIRTSPQLLPTETPILGGRYRVRRLLGRGGMADVFLGDDLLLERAVAIKIMRHDIADESGLERFRREAIALAAVRSPHIVGIHDIGLAEAGVYLVMQHIDGQTIEQEIARGGPMSHVRVEKLLTQLLDGLAEMHAQGLVHRDIKAANVLLDHTDHVTLLDLGIVLDTRHAPLTAPGMVAGTPEYLPPETRHRAESEFTSDVYQVGLLMLYMLTGVDLGRRPKHSLTENVLRLAAPLGPVARRALADDPTKRFPSAAIMRTAMQDAVAPDREPLPADRPRIAAEHRTTTELAPAHLLALLASTHPMALSAEARRTAKTTELRGPPNALARGSTDEINFDIVLPASKVVHLPPQRKVLIIGDAECCATIHRLLLASHEVLTVDTALEALQRIQRGARYDAILCGLAMPMYFHRTLVEACPEQAALIIFLTHYISTRDARAFLTTVNNPSLDTPFELALLKQLIDRPGVSLPAGT